MKKKLLISTLLMVGIVPALIGCGGNNPQPSTIFATSIVFDKVEKTIIYDEAATTQESFVLTATVNPSNYNHGTITWGGGKEYDTEYVKLTPSADGKTCTVTANQPCTQGIDVYARIMGEHEELTARCTVTVNKKKVQATAIDFVDDSALNGTISNSIDVPYTITPATNDSLISVIFSNDKIASGTPLTSKNCIRITPKTPGTTTIKIAAYDGDTKLCESSKTITLNVADIQTVNVQPGTTAKTQCTNLITKESTWNVFKLTVTNNLSISKTRLMKIFVTPKDAAQPDTNQVSVYVGMREKGSSNWIIYTPSGESSSAQYKEDYPTTLEAGKEYYIELRNKTALASNAYDIHVQLPEAE